MPKVDYGTAAFQLVNGVETKVSDFTVPPPRLLVAENCFAERTGALRKRKGVSSLVSQTVDGDSSALARAVALTKYKGDLVALGGATLSDVLQYSETAARWTEHGQAALGVMQSEVTSTAGNGRSIWGTDIDVCNNYTLMAQVEDGVDDLGVLNTTIRVTLQDADGVFLCNRMQVFTHGPTLDNEKLGLRVVHLGSQFYVFFHNNATRDLLVWLLDVSSPATITAALNTSGGGSAASPVTVATDLHASGLPVFDVAADGANSSPNGVFVCYMTTTANQLKFGFVSATGVLSGTSTIAGVATARRVAVTVQSATLHGIAYVGSGAGEVYAAIRSWNGSAWTATATSASLDVGVASSVACRFDSATVLRVWYQGASIFQTTFTTAGVIVTRAVRLLNAELASRPFIGADTRLYFWVLAGLRTAPIIQPTHFLVDSLTGMPVGQANIGVGTFNLLTTVIESAGAYVTSMLYITEPTNGSTEFDRGTNVGIRKVSWFQVHPQACQTAELGDSLMLAAALPQEYDGVTFVENSFLRLVESDLITYTPGAGGSLTPGATYFYRVVPEWTNARGVRQQGADTGPSPIVTMGASNRVTLVIPTITMTRRRRTNTVTGDHQTARSNLVFAIYRTTASPLTSSAPFYRVGTVENTTTASTVTYVDDAPDTDIDDGAQLYRVSGEVEHIAPPPCHIMCEGNGRLLLAGYAEQPCTVFPSLLRSPGEPANFNDALSIVLPEHGGAITGMVVMNDALVVFKEAAIYRVRGLGPDNTLTSGSFADAELVSTDVGCVGQRGLVLTPFGIMFQAPRGFYLLDMGYQLTYVGAPLEGLDDPPSAVNPCRGSLLLPQSQQVRFHGVSSTWVFDYWHKIWTVYTDSTVPSVEWKGAHAYLGSVSAVQSVLYESDGAVWTASNFRIVLGWVKLPPSSQQDIHVKRFGVTGYIDGSAANLRIQLRKNLRDDVVQTKLAPALPGGTLQKTWRTITPAAVCSSLQVEIDDNGTGADGSLSLNEIMLELGARGRGPSARLGA